MYDDVFQLIALKMTYYTCALYSRLFLEFDKQGMPGDTGLPGAAGERGHPVCNQNY